MKKSFTQNATGSVLSWAATLISSFKVPEKDDWLVNSIKV
jgi:hypothetical protein